MIPRPSLRELVDQAVDLGLRADVDPARRLVEDEDLRSGRQPAGQHDLLLVAARQLADLLVERRGLAPAAAPRTPR